jgi:hypothetical protein
MSTMTAADAQALLDTKANGFAYLRALAAGGAVAGLDQRPSPSGKHQGEQRIYGLNTNAQLFAFIAQTWSGRSSAIVRSLFRDSPKFTQLSRAAAEYDQALTLWQQADYGDPEQWMIPPGQLERWLDARRRADDYRSLMIAPLSDRLTYQVDEARAIDRYKLQRNLRELRNNMIELWMFEQAGALLSLGNTFGFDFLYNDHSWDQKVAISPGKAFKDQHGADWAGAAAAQPEELARSLYTHQGAARFCANDRFLFVLDQPLLDAAAILNRLNRCDLGPAHQITFSGTGVHRGEYSVQAHVVLLFSDKR